MDLSRRIFKPSHRLWCAKCRYATPHACRAELQVPVTAPGLIWQCATCGHAAARSYHSVSVSERIEGSR